MKYTLSKIKHAHVEGLKKKKPFFFLPLCCLSFQVSAVQIVIDDFTDSQPRSQYDGSDARVTTGSMLGGYRLTDAFGGLTPITTGGAQTGYSWRNGGSNTGNAWGMTTVGTSVVELDLDLGSQGYIQASFLEVMTGLQVRAEVSSYRSGYGYGIKYDVWESPVQTLFGGSQNVTFLLSSFLPDSHGMPVSYSDIDAVRLWITQVPGIYPAPGDPAYVLDRVSAVSAVPEPGSLSLIMSGFSLLGLAAFWRSNPNSSPSKSQTSPKEEMV